SDESGFADIWRGLDEVAFGAVDEAFAGLPDWVAQVVTWGETSDMLIVRDGGDVEGFRIRAGYYKGIEGAVEVLEGALPSDDLPEGIDAQIALSATAAQRLNVSVGDRIVLDQRGWDTSLPISAEISAIVTPLDDTCAFWMSP